MKTLKEIWATGRSAVGVWLSIPSAITAEPLARAGFDYVCVDNQHGVLDYQTSVRALQTIGLGSSMPMARAPWNEPGIIGKLLDAGALGVIVPMVNSGAEAEAAVSACHYPPKGARSFGPIAAAIRHDDYFSRAPELVTCIPMVETVQALSNIDDILSVPGVDAVYVGPADLSVSLGLPPRNNDDVPAFTEALETVVAACERHGVVPGIHASVDLTPKRLEMGFRMVTATSDLIAMRAGLAPAAGLVASGETDDDAMY